MLAANSRVLSGIARFVRLWPGFARVPLHFRVSGSCGKLAKTLIPSRNSLFFSMLRLPSTLSTGSELGKVAEASESDIGLSVEPSGRAKRALPSFHSFLKS
jgi:hypothetical protein